MATTTNRADSVLANLPANFAPMPAVMRTLAQFDRPKLEGFITVAIGLLDVLDGNADDETNGDELDGNGSEDDFMFHGHSGPGCPIADPDAAVDDSPCNEPFMDLEPEDGAV